MQQLSQNSPKNELDPKQLCQNSHKAKYKVNGSVVGAKSYLHFDIQLYRGKSFQGVCNTSVSVLAEGTFHGELITKDLKKLELDTVRFEFIGNDSEFTVYFLDGEHILGQIDGSRVSFLANESGEGTGSWQQPKTRYKVNGKVVSTKGSGSLSNLHFDVELAQGCKSFKGKAFEVDLPATPPQHGRIRGDLFTNDLLSLHNATKFVFFGTESHVKLFFFSNEECSKVVGEVCAAHIPFLDNEDTGEGFGRWE